MSAACWHTETTPTGGPSTANMVFAECCAAFRAAGAAGIGDLCSRSRTGIGMGECNWRCSLRRAEKRIRTPFHRVVRLKLCPCTADHEGWEVDPYMVQIGGLTDGLYDHFWEVRHDNRDVRDYSVGNLFTPWWEVRQQLPRPR